MSNTYDDPNREAVGLPPIWTGAGAEVEPQVKASKTPKAAREAEVTEVPTE